MVQFEQILDEDFSIFLMYPSHVSKNKKGYPMKDNLLIFLVGSTGLEPVDPAVWRPNPKRGIGFFQGVTVLPVHVFTHVFLPILHTDLHIVYILTRTVFTLAFRVNALFSR